MTGTITLGGHLPSFSGTSLTSRYKVYHINPVSFSVSPTEKKESSKSDKV